MAKEIQTLVWCDLCLGEEEAREEATHRDLVATLGLGARAKPQSLDLCERHYKQVYEPLLDALGAYGASVQEAPQPRWAKASEKGAGRTGPFVCEFPGCDSTPSNVASFGSHVRQQHGITVGEYRETFGAPVKVGEATQARAPEAEDPELFDSDDVPAIGPNEATCEVCGESWSHAKGNSRPAQARGVHMARVHGIKGKGKTT